MLPLDDDGEWTKLNFEPHGLVLKWILQDNYSWAKSQKYGVGIEDEVMARRYSRQATLHYFEDLFNKIVFHDDNFSVNAGGQLLSTPGPEKSSDITVTYWGQNGGKWTSCFAECLGGDEATHLKLADMHVLLST